MTVIKRKLYKRGSSVETTIPKPLLFALDTSKKHDVLFKYDISSGRWYIEFEETRDTSTEKTSDNIVEKTGEKTAAKVGKRGRKGRR
ncbi:TPA: hypothetical protein HA265_08515 [Candidatus Woesearchaeota archaeon]|nr:hypothetical protein [Candidatus Woesearchaeota archaeon]